MLNYFRELPRGQKIGFICLVLAGIGFFIYFIAGVINNDADPNPKPSASVTLPANDPSATNNPPDSVTTPTASPTTSAIATATPTVVFGESTLNIDEARAAQDFVDNALKSFLVWPATEKPADRTNKLTPLFVKGSEYPTFAPDMEKLTSYDDGSGKNQAVSVASIDYINSIGGNEKLYRINVGAVLSIQYNYSDVGDEKSGVIKTSGSYNVDLTKENGAWKIKDITVN